MRSRVADDISFRFDDSAAQTYMRQIVNQRFANEKAREFDGLDGELAATKAADADFSASGHHANRSIIAKRSRAAGIIFSKLCARCGSLAA